MEYYQKSAHKQKNIIKQKIEENNMREIRYYILLWHT